MGAHRNISREGYGLWDIPDMTSVEHEPIMGYRTEPQVGSRVEPLVRGNEAPKAVG